MIRIERRRAERDHEHERDDHDRAARGWPRRTGRPRRRPGRGSSPWTRPSAVPRTVPSSVASGAMIRMSRAPTMTRESTSRPSWSVPNQCAPDGAWLNASRFCVERVVRGDRLPEDGADDPQQQDDRADQEGRRAQQQPHLVGVARRSCDRGRDRRPAVRRGAPGGPGERRRRGSRRRSRSSRAPRRAAAGSSRRGRDRSAISVATM